MPGRRRGQCRVALRRERNRKSVKHVGVPFLKACQSGSCRHCAHLARSSLSLTWGSPGLCSTTPGRFLLRKEQLNLKAQGPRTALVGSHDIVERSNVGVHCLAANVQDLAASPAHGHRPLIPRSRFPIRCHDGRTGKVPAIRKVVVHKWLHLELVNALSIVLTPNRRHVGD
jgi:hypothetical protein